MKTRVMMLTLFTMAMVGTCAAGVMGSTFTYQGVLTDGGSPVSGDVDLRFSLWDASSGGGQIGSSIVVGDVAVSDGRVTVPLDFGDVFDIYELWLAVEVRDGGSTGAYTLLTPRQELTAAPFAASALKARTAESAAMADHATWASGASSATTASTAALADNASMLESHDGDYYLTWSNLMGTPAGLDDGDDDTLDSLSCSSGQFATWNGSTWECGGPTFGRTVIVGPVGNAAANGAALVAALDAIPVPSGPADGILIQVEPGEYDLGGENFMLWDWVSLRGAGRNVTRIYSKACSPANRVLFLGKGELSDLTIENTCATGSAHALGVEVGSMSDGARISRVNIVLNGATLISYGIRNGSDDVFLEDLQVSIDGSSSAYGIQSSSASLFVVDSIVNAVGSSSGTGLDLTASARAITSRGNLSGSTYGVRAWGASIDASDSNFDGDDAAISMYGTGGEQEGHFSRIAAHGRIHIDGDGVDDVVVRIHHSRISDFTNTVVLDAGTGTVRVAGSELAGGPVSGAVQCVSVWDEGTGFYPNTCP